MYFGAPQVLQLPDGLLGRIVRGGADGQGDQHLIGVQTGIAVAQMGRFEFLDGADGTGGHQLHFIGYMGQGFQGIQQHGGGGPQKFAGLARDDPAVRQLNGGGGLVRGRRFHFGGADHRTVIHCDAGLLHQQLQFQDLLVIRAALPFFAQGAEISADDFLTGGFPAGRVIHNT